MKDFKGYTGVNVKKRDLEELEHINNLMQERYDVKLLEEIRDILKRIENKIDSK